MADAPIALFSDQRLSPGAKVLGVLLWRYAKHTEGTPFVWPSTSTLNEQLGCGPRTLRRYLAELRSAGFVTDEARRVGGHDQHGWMLARSPSASGQDCPPDGQNWPQNGQNWPQNGQICPPKRSDLAAKAVRFGRENDAPTSISQRHDAAKPSSGEVGIPIESPLKPEREERSLSREPSWLTEQDRRLNSTPPRPGKIIHGRGRGVVGLVEADGKPGDVDALIAAHREAFVSVWGRDLAPNLEIKIQGLFGYWSDNYDRWGGKTALGRLLTQLAEDAAKQRSRVRKPTSTTGPTSDDECAAIIASVEARRRPAP